MLKHISEYPINVHNMRALEHKISILDNTVFSIEMDCRRKHQQIQELTAQKDIVEKLIAKVLNNDEDYSRIKQITKEAVKAVIS